jgi:NAD(P)H-dependent FMN reductase
MDERDDTDTLPATDRPADDDRLRVVLLVGSNREGRHGGVVGQWAAHQLWRRPDLEVDVIDLAELDLPAVHPAVRDERVHAFAARIDAADAFVVVTPEYNHGYPAALKHAIDQVNVEWRGKAVGFISYGGMSGGIRAVEQLRQVFAEVHAATVRDGVAFAGAWLLFDEHGELRDPTDAEAAAKLMLDQLVWWARALHDARAVRPYAA